MLKSLILLFCLVSAQADEPEIAAGPVAAPAQAAAPQAFRYERHTLGNGLKVLLYKDDSVPVTTVNIWYNVGSKHERPGRTGFAHLFEHYMFECTKNIGEGEYFKRIFTEIGGIANANTSYDRTDYYAVVPSEAVDEVLRLESDRMGFLQECLNQRLLDKERGIVQEEKKLREAEPYGLGLFGKMTETVFDHPHGYHWPIIGYMRDLEAASLQDVAQFHKTYYVPNNAVMVIAGDLPANVLERVEFWFGGLQRGPQPPAANTPNVANLGGRREVNMPHPNARLPLVTMIYPIPGLGRPGHTEMSVLASVLGGGKTSRLNKALVDGAAPKALNVSAGVIGLHENDLFIVQAMPTPGTSTAELEAAIERELAGIVRAGITPREMARVKAGMRLELLDKLQKSEDLAVEMAEGEAVLGDPAAFTSRLQEIEALRVDDIKAGAAQYLRDDNTAVVRVVPEAGQ